MPRALPANFALIDADPAPLEPHEGFPHTVVEFPIDDLLVYGGFSLLAAATSTPLPASALTPTEPEAAL